MLAFLTRWNIPQITMKKTLTLVIILGGALGAQTTIDLGRQSRNVDFSNSVSTKTFKTGTALPASCSQGETYLKLDAPSGQNMYACTSANIWIPQGSGTVVSTSSFDWTRVTPTQAQVSQGSFRFGTMVTKISNSGTFTIQGFSTGSIWVYGVATGKIVIGHNLGAGNLSLSGAGFVVDSLGTGFPVGSLPLYLCSVSSGTLPVSCTDLRTNLSSTAVGAGPSGGLSVDCSAGNTCVVDIVSAAVPLTTGANTLTGLNTFSHMKLPSGAMPDPAQCGSASDAGKIWIQTTAVSGRQLYVCEGVAGWRVQGGPVNLSTAANIGFVSSLPIATALSAQTSVASSNQVRLVLTPVFGQVRIARLAAWIATASAGGKARVGIYKTDGTLVAQTGDLDTSSSAGRDSVLTPVLLDSGYYYFAWAVDNTTARLAGSGTGTMTGLFNRVSASPGQATCSESMTAAGLPGTCTIVPWPATDGFPVIAVAGFAQ
jgi:hypothetical protein